MSITRQSLRAYADAQKLAGADEHRLPLATEDALSLSKLLADSEIEHLDQVRHAASELDGLIATEALEEFKTKNQDEKARHYRRYQDAANDFWDGFMQTKIDGVEIIRRA